MDTASGKASSIQFFIHVPPSEIKTSLLPKRPYDSIKQSIYPVKTLLLPKWATYCECLIQLCFPLGSMHEPLVNILPTFTSFHPSSRVCNIEPSACTYNISSFLTGSRERLSFTFFPASFP